jgi:CRP-like cAMP-binding protein
MRDNVPAKFLEQHPEEKIYEWMFKALSTFHPLSEALKQAIIDCTKIKYFYKSKVIMQANEVCSYCYFAYTGYVKGYKTGNGKQFVEWFMGPGSIIIRPESFHKRVLSKGYVSVLEDMAAIELSYENFVFLKEEFPAFRDINEKAVDHYYDLSLEREEMRNRTGEENLEVLLALHPRILEVAGVVNVASYLGITREGLAKIRKKSAL